MSQGFHKGNIFSFSDDEFDHQRPQQNHIAQQSRRDKLRVQQHGLFDAAAATGHPPLVAIQEEADQKEDVGIYGPAGTSNMLISEMFNFPAPAFGGLLHHGHTAGLHQGSTDAVMSYHRLIQLQRPADSFYGCNSRPDQLQLHHNIITPASSTTWSSVVLADECLNLVGGEVMERQLGASQLSLSSSELQQLEMRRRAENQMRVISRSEQAGGDHSFFFLNSASSNINEHQEDELPAPQPFLHQQACHQQGQQAHNMSYGPVAALSIFRNSLYARAAQELLEEFCSVGRERLISAGINNKGAGRSTNSSFNPPAYNPTHIRGGTAASSAAAAASSSAAAASSSSSKEIPPLSSADRFEGQRKKSKLLSMLDEVERRYNHYCEQMQMVVNSFESAMGLGAATPYTALAHKAMSRHFRCLKDGIAGQLKKTCELLGDKEAAAGALILINGSGGLTKVETPKLRLIDQSLRQQRAFHHHNLGMMAQQQQDQPGYWRPQRGLPDRSVTMLRAWLFDHFLHPYPSDADKHLLARQTGLSRNQVSNWFINARVRLWKPMVEDMYQKEAKEAEDSQQQQQQQQQHNNDDDHDQTIINSHTSIILSAATTRQLHDHSISPPAQNPTLLILHTPEYSASPECVPMPRQNLRSQIVAPINSNPQPPQPPEDDMYRRPAALLGRPSTAASQARTTGDLSLTLGLRHAGSVNPPETAAGRFVGL